MKKFIKALEDKGTIEFLVSSSMFTEEISGGSISMNDVEKILDLEFRRDEDLEHIFLEEAHIVAKKSVFEYVKKQILERQKAEVMNKVDFDGLLEKATGNMPEQKKESKDLDAKIEDMLFESLSKVADELFKELFNNITKNILDDGK